MAELLTRNAKLRLTSEINNIKISNFGIPAFKEANGRIICVYAGICNENDSCYAQQNAYTWGPVKNAYQKRYEMTLLDRFGEAVTDEIKRKKIERVRIHDSGDFYSPKYLKKWTEIARNNPKVTFYAYTKSLPFFKDFKQKKPKNFLDPIKSFGGKCDHMIDVKKDRHARIFEHEKDIPQGYINASHDDMLATTRKKKIALIYHGAKSRTFSV